MNYQNKQEILDISNISKTISSQTQMLISKNSEFLENQQVLEFRQTMQQNELQKIQRDFNRTFQQLKLDLNKTFIKTNEISYDKVQELTNHLKDLIIKLTKLTKKLHMKESEFLKELDNKTIIFEFKQISHDLQKSISTFKSKLNDQNKQYIQEQLNSQTLYNTKISQINSQIKDLQQQIKLQTLQKQQLENTIERIQLNLLFIQNSLSSNTKIPKTKIKSDQNKFNNHNSNNNSNNVNLNSINNYYDNNHQNINKQNVRMKNENISEDNQSTKVNHVNKNILNVSDTDSDNTHDQITSNSKNNNNIKIIPENNQILSDDNQDNQDYKDQQKKNPQDKKNQIQNNYTSNDNNIECNFQFQKINFENQDKNINNISQDNNPQTKKECLKFIPQSLPIIEAIKYEKLRQNYDEDSYQKLFCIVIFDNNDYMQDHNKHINSFFQKFQSEIVQKYQNQYQYYNQDGQQEENLKAKSSYFLTGSQKDTEIKFLSQIIKILEEKKQFKNIHIFIIGCSNLNQQKLTLSQENGNIQQQIANNKQSVCINIIDISLKENTESLNKLNTYLNKNNVISSICNLKNYSKNYDIISKLVLDYFLIRLDNQRLQTINQIQIQKQNEKKIKIEKQIQQYNNLITKHKNDLQQIEFNITQFFNQIDDQKQLLEQVKLEQIKEIDQQKNILNFNQIIFEEYFKNNDLFLKGLQVQKDFNLKIEKIKYQLLQEDDYNISIFKKIIKYLNTFLISLNIPQKEYIQLEILQLYIYNHDSPNPNLNHTLQKMLYDIFQNHHEDLLNLFQNCNLSMSDIVSDKLNEENKQYKSQLRKIQKIIIKYDLKSIFKIKPISKIDKLFQKMEYINETLLQNIQT